MSNAQLLYLHIHRSDAFLRRDAFDLLLLRLIFYFADRIFTLSEDIFLLANGSSFNHLRHKFFYLPNTLDPHYEALAESFNVSDAELSPKPLLFFSNIQKTKGIDTFLNLHARVAPRGFCSVVCGSIIDSDYLHSIERPSLIYLGPIFSDARKLEIFSQSSCLILPQNEGFPLVVLEAMYWSASDLLRIGYVQDMFGYEYPLYAEDHPAWTLNSFNI